MVIKGYWGEVKTANGLVGEVKNYSLDVASDIVDATTLGSNGWRRNVATIRGWSGSCTVHFDTNDQGQNDIRAALMAGESLQMTFYVGKNESGTKYYQGTAFVKSGSLTNDVAGLAEVTFSFEGNGELVEGVVQ